MGALAGRSTRDASSTRRGTDKLLAISSKAPGMAPKDKTAESYNMKEEKRLTTTSVPRQELLGRPGELPALPSALAPAASAAAQRPAGQPAQ
eukprot:6397285-Pyramimonas_sp.AAC.1